MMARLFAWLFGWAVRTTSGDTSSYTLTAGTVPCASAHPRMPGFVIVTPPTGHYLHVDGDRIGWLLVDETVAHRIGELLAAHGLVDVPDNLAGITRKDQS